MLVEYEDGSSKQNVVMECAGGGGDSVALMVIVILVVVVVVKYNGDSSEDRKFKSRSTRYSLCCLGCGDFCGDKGVISYSFSLVDYGFLPPRYEVHILFQYLNLLAFIFTEFNMQFENYNICILKSHYLFRQFSFLRSDACRSLQ